MTTAILSSGFNFDAALTWSITARLALTARSSQRRGWQNYLTKTTEDDNSSVFTWDKVQKQITEIGGLTHGWDTYGGAAPGSATIAYAVAMLSGLKAMDLPAPIVTPSGEGEILAAWSGKGIDVEVWFQRPNQETVVVDDEQNAIPPVTGRDPRLVDAIRAIREMHRRG